MVLVTHFMEEAERLCDRVALIDGGRLVAIDTPAGLVSRVDTEQRIRFRPSGPIDDAVIADLPGVSGISRSEGQIVVTGVGNVVATVIAAMAARGVTALELRVDQATLDDAFVVLTGRASDTAGATDHN